MEFHTKKNLLGNITNQSSKFRAKNWIEINDGSRWTHSIGNQITFKTSMLKSSLGDSSDAYILVKGIIAITEAGTDAAARQADEGDKG